MSVRLVVLLLPLSLVAVIPTAGAQGLPSSPIEIHRPLEPNDGKVVSERNVRVDVTVAVKGAEKTVSKSLSLVAADGKQVQGRAGVQLPIVMNQQVPNTPPNVSYREIGINVDASPTILPSGRISVSMKLSFSNVLQVQAGGAGERPSFGSGSQEVNGVVFDSGKPLVVLEGGDPETGRTYTVQVTATILK